MLLAVCLTLAPTSGYTQAAPQVSPLAKKPVIAGLAPPPGVIIEQATDQADPARLVPIIFSVTFSEAVTGFTGSDLTLGGTAVPSQASVTGSGSSYSVAVSGMAGGGTVLVSVPAGVAENGAGQFNTASTSVDNQVLFDGTPPTLLSFLRAAPLEQMTDADVLVFRAVFSEPVTMPLVQTFSVSGSTTAQVTSVVALSADDYEVTVSGGNLVEFNGVLGLNLRPTQNLADVAGNRLPTAEPRIDETYLVDNPGPQADLSISLSDGRQSVGINGLLDYVMTVANAGPDDVTGGQVESLVPVELTNASWICDAGPGASCTASGNGDINDLVDLPADTEVVYTLTATVDVSDDLTIQNTSSVLPPMNVNDPNTGNNFAADITQVVEGIFSDSFESSQGLIELKGLGSLPRLLPEFSDAKGLQVHQRFNMGWQVRISYWDHRGYWIAGKWLLITEP